MKKAASVLVSALALVLIAPVSASGAVRTDDDVRPLRANPPLSDSPRLTIESDLYPELQGEDKRVVHEAQERVVLHCMQRQAVPYTTVPWAQVLEYEHAYAKIEGRRRTIEQHLVHDPAWVAEHGYDVQPEDINPTIPMPPEETSPQQYTALFGTDAQRETVVAKNGAQMTYPGVGCIPESERIIYGDLRTWKLLRLENGEFRFAASRQLHKDSALTTLEREWGECMTRHNQPGFSAQYRAYKRARELHAAHAPDARATEIAIAMADSACVREVAYFTRAADSEDRLVRELLSQQNPDAMQYISVRSAGVAKAREIMKGTFQS